MLNHLNEISQELDAQNIFKRIVHRSCINGTTAHPSAAEAVAMRTL